MPQLTETNIFYIAQGLGVVAIILGFINYIVKTRGQVIFFNSLTTVCFVLHYLCLGAWAGMALNFVGFIRNIVYYYAGKNGKVNKVLTLAFTVLMCAMGITVSLLAKEGWYFVLSVTALTINTFAMSLANPNHIRKSILITSPLVLAYDCFVLSAGGAVYESVAIISAVIGLIRYRKKSLSPKSENSPTPSSTGK